MSMFNSQTALSRSEGYDLTTQRHYLNRCKFFHKKCSFRRWKVLLFFLVLAVIIIVMGLLIAMFGPGNTNLKYSEKEALDGPTVVINGGNEHTFTDVTPGKETVEPTEQKSTGTPKSTPTTPPTEKTPLQCGVAILGGGIAGLLLAATLLESKNETNVCIFEKENRLGGKILDHRFPVAPNVTVGLGRWNIYGANPLESEIPKYLSIQSDPWIRNIRRVESRGVYEDDFDSLKSKAFPSVSNRPPFNTTTIQQIAEDISFESENKFSTAGSFLSNYLWPEGAKLMEEVYGFKGGYMQAINPKSYKTYLIERVDTEKQKNKDERPTRGMSEIIDKLILKVRSFNGNIYLQETVTSISKEGDKFVLLTTNFTVEANKTILTVGPTALKMLTGDVIQSITSHDIFKSIVGVPAFSGAAVYPTAWWNDSIATQKNNSLEPLQMFVSSSYCLGITMPYNGTGVGGTAVLHTVANNGECSDMWGNILKVSKDAVDREMRRALEYKFQRTIPVALDTVYKYWEEGYWYLQKPGSNFTLTGIREWAKRPLAGNDVFLVGKAFHNFGGWLQDTIKSANIALKEGWNLKFTWLPH